MKDNYCLMIVVMTNYAQIMKWFPETIGRTSMFVYSSRSGSVRGVGRLQQTRLVWVFVWLLVVYIVTVDVVI